MYKTGIRNDAYGLALLLKAKSSELSRFDLNLPFGPTSELPLWPNPPGWVTEHGLKHLLREVEELLTALDQLRHKEHFDAHHPPLQEGEFWSLGAIKFRFAPRPIHRGFLEPARYANYVILDEGLVAYLITVSGDDHTLKREHHDHFGWHYHYLDRKKRRSDVILCWDTFAKVTSQDNRSLFYEGHAEGNSSFPARPNLWAERKRKSIHDACGPDLLKWPINEFKAPGKTSVAVWPLGAVLTPKPESAANSKPFKAKNGGGRKGH
ncbi:hypothetical protein NKI32_28205 [Mesorhizobium sp. M0761]|uniref:hypothetical protein n=1 Tax=Mesorhizobium sp. M0761 TaxID=2956994 RepID=UPI0033376489